VRRAPRSAAPSTGARNPRIKGPHAPQQKVGFEAAEDRTAIRRAQNAPSHRSSRVGADAAVAVQVFCRRMHDVIGAEGQRTSFSTGVAAVPSTAGSAPAAPAMSITHHSGFAGSRSTEGEFGLDEPRGAARRAMGIAKVTSMPEASAKFFNPLRRLQYMTCGAAT